jgi:hypothetical protein
MWQGHAVAPLVGAQPAAYVAIKLGGGCFWSVGMVNIPALTMGHVDLKLKGAFTSLNL